MQVIQGNSFDEGTYVNVGDKSVDVNQEQATMIHSTKSRGMSSGSGNSSSQRNLFDSVDISENKKVSNISAAASPANISKPSPKSLADQGLTLREMNEISSRQYLRNIANKTLEEQKELLL